jgi:hypothetical protein
MNDIDDLAGDHVAILGQIGKLKVKVVDELRRGNVGNRKYADDILGVLQGFETKYDKATKDAGQTKQLESVAKAFPGLASGIVGVVDGARQTPPDAMAISAGVMDMLGSIGSAAPPPFGAALGALFSVISIFLKAFAPKAPSLLEQMETLLRKLQAEEAKTKIRAAGEAVAVYANAGDLFMATCDKACEGDNIPNPALLTKHNEKLNLLEGNAITAIREVAVWLQDNADKDIKDWPEILSFMCEAYTAMWSAVTAQYAYSNNEDIRKAYTENPADSEENRKQKRKDWKDLQTEMAVQNTHLGQNDILMKNRLDNLVPLVRKCGIYVAVQPYTTNVEGPAGTHARGDLIVASGPRAFKENKWVSIRNHCARVAVTPPRQGITGPDADYEMWIIDTSKYGGAQLSYEKFNIKTRERNGGGQIGNQAINFTDAWPDPATGADGNFTIYATTNAPKWNTKNRSAIQRWNWNRNNNNLSQVSWELPADQTLSQVRVVRPKIFNRDPDKIPGEFQGRLDKGASIIYGTLDGTRNVFVSFTDVTEGNQKWTVQIRPQSYKGIAVDPHFLWIYGHESFGCASHASVLKAAITGGTPRWLGHYHPNSNESGDALDLSFCEDGTVTYVTPSLVNTATCRIDIKSGLYDLGKSEYLNELNTPQVYKLPIYCWQKVVALMESVKSTGIPTA